ncbi:MAG: cytochrome c3 family protein [Gammaproteobacteria bacterium]|nr:cytochrome c3 family protein [Gammaproteobacteria bacterium]
MALLTCKKKVALLLTTLSAALFSLDTSAEYGDVLLNNYSEASGMNPVVFPHWFHRIRFTCKVCHADLGFELKAGANDIKMIDILEGQFCGKCHNGDIAWGSENCLLCHSGKSRIQTHIQRDPLQNIFDPSSTQPVGQQGAIPNAQ